MPSKSIDASKEKQARLPLGRAPVDFSGDLVLAMSDEMADINTF